MTSNLPQGWIECELKEIANEIISGTGFPKVYQGMKKGDYPFAKVGDISKLFKSNCKTISFAENYINEDIKKKIQGKVFPINTIVFPKIGEALKGNYRLITKKEMLFDNNVMGFVSYEFINVWFLYYFLTTQDFGKFSVATTVPSIQKGNIEKIQIKLPPLNEQQRIVEKIESEFEKIDKGIEYLTKAKEQIKQYRQSVLKSAFEGKLYKTTEWEEEKLKNLCYKIEKRRISNDINEEFLYIDISSVDNIKNILIGATAYNGQNAPSRARQIIKSGDILFSTVRTYLRNIAIVDEYYDNQIASTGFCVIRSKEQVLYNKFIFYKCLSQVFLSPLNKLQRGSSYPAVRNDDVLNQCIYLPSLNEQQKIVEEIEKRFKIADEVEKIINENLEKAKQLKQSILKKAFEGKLVPQDPNDEPASVLLERIKSERDKNERK